MARTATGPGELTVSQGGSTRVDTNELYDLAARLAVTGADARGWVHSARVAERVVDSLPAAEPFNWAADPLRTAARETRAAAEIADVLGPALDRAAENYRAADTQSASLLQLLSSLTGVIGGAVLRVGLIGLLPYALPYALPLTAAALIAQNPEVKRLFAALGEATGLDLMMTGLVNNPNVITAVRTIVSMTDDALMGFAGAPPAMAGILGESGTGVVGLGSVAAGVIGVRSLAGIRESPLFVRRVSAAPTAPPQSVSDLAARIPPAQAGAPQVRVERYGTSAAPRYAVYVSGTSSASLTPDREPFDMTSNLSAIAGGDAASQRAVEKALQAAGVTPSDPVTLVGHSQGGLVAARVAESGDYSVNSLVTFGAPAGQIDVPPSVTQLAVEHGDDIVPALGGAPLTGAEASDRLVASRVVYPGGPPPDSGVIPAHQLDAYRETAEQIDASDNPRFDDIRATINELGGKTQASGTAEHYRAARVGD